MASSQTEAVLTGPRHPASNPTPPPHRFVTLDLLRGIAALVVVYFHTHFLFGPNLFQHGYLAVDFFFMLSGFVLMSAYGRRLRTGWPTLDFMKNRVARLYPLYFLGLTLAFAFPLVFHLLGRQHTLSAPFEKYLFGLGFVPFLFGPGSPSSYLYPLNTPTWSLFLELLVNLFHATLLRRPGLKLLCGVVFTSGAALILAVLHLHTMEFGQNRATFFYGLLRALFAYTTGMLLFRLWERGALQHRRWPVLASALALVLLLGAPVFSVYAGVYDLAVTLFAFPALLLLSASAIPPGAFSSVCLLLGNASYAIYVLHFPAGNWLAQLVAHLPPLQGLHAPWIGLLYLATILTLSILLDRVYDLPARTFLRHRLQEMPGQSTAIAD